MHIANILLRILSCIFISDNGLSFSFFVVSLCGFGIRMMLASQKEFGSLLSSRIFWNSLRRIGVSSSLNVLQNSPVKPPCSQLLCTWSFLITDSILSALICLFKRFFSLFSFGDHIFLGICPFHPGFQIYWNILSCSQ